jgi:hypothetical protein
MYKLLIVLFISTSFISLGQENKEIEIRQVIKTITTDYMDGSSKSKSGKKYEWRFKEDSTWKSTGKRYNDIAPVLNQYENSSHLFKQSKLLLTVGVYGSFGVTLGGLGMVLFGIDTEDPSEEAVFNPSSGLYEQPKHRGLLIAGVATTLAGMAGVSLSYYFGWKKLEESFVEYNKSASRDVGSSYGRGLNIGLTSSNMSSYPMLSLRLSL